MKLNNSFLVSKVFVAVLGTAAAFLTTSAAASTEVDYPNGPIELVVPYGPGGGSDRAIRSVVNQFEKNIGTSVRVVNRSGGGGFVGTKFVKDAAADGYTLGATTLSTFGGAQASGKNPPYDVKSDFDFVAVIAETPRLLAVSSEFPATNYQEFIDYVAANPGEVTYAVTSNSTDQFNASVFKKVTRLDLVEVSYSGKDTSYRVDVATNRVNAIFETLGSASLNIQQGDFRVLALSSPHPDYPDVPVFPDLGLPQLGTTSFFGIVVPKGVDKSIIDKLNAAFDRAALHEDTVKNLQQYGLVPVGGSVVESQEYHLNNINSMQDAADVLTD